MDFEFTSLPHRPWNPRGFCTLLLRSQDNWPSAACVARRDAHPRPRSAIDVQGLGLVSHVTYIRKQGNRPKGS